MSVLSPERVLHPAMEVLLGEARFLPLNLTGGMLGLGLVNVSDTGHICRVDSKSETSSCKSCTVLWGSVCQNPRKSPIAVAVGAAGETPPVCGHAQRGSGWVMVVRSGRLRRVSAWIAACAFIVNAHWVLAIRSRPVAERQAPETPGCSGRRAQSSAELRLTPNEQ